MIAYTSKQWETVNNWTRSHRAQIHLYGPTVAARVARFGRGSFPDYLRDRFWEPCRGCSPTAEQIVESLIAQRLWRRDRADARPRVSFVFRGGRQT